MSGYNEQHVSQAIEAGAVSGFLKKPFALPQLHDQLRAAEIVD